MNRSDREPSAPAVEQYLDVLRAARAAGESLVELDCLAFDEPDRRWTTLRREAARAEVAAISAASSRGRLARYEAAVRALTAETVPLADSPVHLQAHAQRVAGRLELLAQKFRGAQEETVPAENTISLALRAASRLFAAETFAAAIGDPEVHLRALRTASSATAESVRSDQVQIDDTGDAVAELGGGILEIWVRRDSGDVRQVTPVLVRTSNETSSLFALPIPVAGSDLTGYLRLPVDDDDIEIQFGHARAITELEPIDAGTVLASIAATGRSWRRYWEASVADLAWLAVAVAQTADDDSRD